ncbi:MAG TPA: chemotaxis protein CheX [Acidobacteriaceae bacterium]|jgi:chemotaxis protein CheX|nr:chemotaxis protein CheX [Acidobacteriaceae bacterium]
MISSALSLADDPVQALDAAVHEVFDRMLGIACVVQATAMPILPMSMVQPVSAILGFAGKFSGSCTLSAAPEAVIAVSQRLLATPGMHTQDNGMDLNNTVLDAFGEVCNMIAGGWKNRMPGLDAGCALSVPIIVCGSDYVLHTVGDRLLVERVYSFAGFPMRLAIRCDAYESAL